MTLRLAMGLLACALIGFAADVAGKWTAEMQTQRGPQTQTFEFKVDSGKLTGTVTGGRGGPAEISEGKIEGDTVTFKVNRTMGDRSFVALYKGTVSGDELKLTMTIEGMDAPPREIAAKRAK